MFNLGTWLLDRNVDEGRGDRPAVRCGSRIHTYAEMRDMTHRCGNALRELGAGIEQRVLMILPDGPEFVAAWCATLEIGAVFAMANTIHTADEYAYYLEYTRAPVVVAHASVMDRLGPALATARYVKGLLLVGATADGPADGPSGEDSRAGSVRVEDWTRFLARQSGRLEPAPTGPDDIAGWLFTSGSTGKPKAAVHMHQDFRYNIERYAKQIVGYRHSDITLSVPKLFFGYATGTNLMFPFAFGGQTALFSERATPETVYAMIEQHRPTVLTSVPTMINGMLQAEGTSRRDLSSLRVCLSAGEALPAELYRRWVERFGVEILDGIGSAEMFHIYISNRLGEVKPGSLGREVPGYEARVVGADGQDVATGETGTLWIKGESRALCYWGSRRTSQETFRGAWCVTGDQFRKDQDGYFWYEGRTDDMLKVGGIFVSPLEIEDCLLAHPAVREVCVIGADDEGGLTKPKAFVVAREGHAPSPELGDALKAFVKGKLAPYKYPRWIEFLDVLPRSDRGKVQRALLRSGAASEAPGDPGKA